MWYVPQHIGINQSVLHSFSGVLRWNDKLYLKTGREQGKRGEFLVLLGGYGAL